MTSLTQGPCWPHGRGQAPWAAWVAVPSVHACAQRHNEGQGDAAAGERGSPSEGWTQP